LLLSKKPEKAADDFWREYEEKTGEKVLTRTLGRYISGWAEFDEKNWGGIWGLLITTTGGFRFHHFPQNSWIDAFTRFTEFAGKEPPKEKTIFLAQEKIILTEKLIESKWWKRIFSHSPPLVIISYLNEIKIEKKLIFEAEYNKT